MKSYSVLTKIIHWTTALLVVVLFGLGLWMAGLNYYDSWYRTAPDLHISLGLCLLVLLIARIINRVTQPFPKSLPSHSRIEQISAKAAHHTLYLLLVVMVATGYFLAGIEGNGVGFFGLFKLPGIPTSGADLEDIFEQVHYFSAWGLVVIAGLHGLAALKHHFIDKDDTLRRMTRS